MRAGTPLPSEAFLREQLASLPPAPRELTDVLSGLTPKQQAVVDAWQAGAKWIALLCGRRAGKTDVFCRIAAHALKTVHDAELVYMALTIESARANMWRPLIRLNRRYNMGLVFDHAKMTIRHPGTGSTLQVRGSETLRDLEKPRGGGFYLVFVDEAGAWRPSYLEYAMDEVLSPAMMDREDSCMLLGGTPGRVAVGPFYELTKKGPGQHDGWDVFCWTAKENPHVNFHRFVHGPCDRCEGKTAAECPHSLLARKKWTIDSPGYKREILALWVIDASALVYRFSAKNVITALPALAPGDQWQWSMGMDFGVGDKTACYVLAWPKRYGRAVYVVDGWSQSGLAPSDAATVIRKTYDHYHKVWGAPTYLVGDVGGLGKAYQAEWNKRHPGIEMRAAKKPDKRGTLEHVSDALHITDVSSPDITKHRGLACMAHLEDLQRQWQTLQWDEDRGDIAEGQDDDDADACMYGYKHSPAFRGVTVLPDTPPPVAKEIAAFLKKPDNKLERGWRGAFRRGRA